MRRGDPVVSDRSGRRPPGNRPLRLAAALAVALLAGLLLHLSGLAGTLAAESAGDRAGQPVAAVEAAADTARPSAIGNRTWTSTWQLALLRNAAAALGGLIAVAVLVAPGTRLRAPTWHLARSARSAWSPATTRHSSPLAARRAPPAPAAC